MSYPGYPPYGQAPPQPGYGQYPPPQPPPGQYPPPGQPPYGGQQYPPPAQNSYYQQPPPGQYPPPQQSGYGAPPPGPSPYAGYQTQQQPPPGQYPPPGQQPPYGGYQQAPPPGHYPPPGGPAPYGAPSPQPSYGGAPPYGAPPQQQWMPPPPPVWPAAPPTPASPGYGAPQHIPWSGDADAQALRTAMKGFGTDEKTLIRVLADKDPLQIEVIKSAYARTQRRDLEADIKSETGGWLETGLLSILKGPLLHDVDLLHDAMAGLGTKESVLNDVLLGRSNADLRAIKDAYNRRYHRRLEDVVKGDLSMKTERHFLIVLGCNRAEDAVPVDPRQVDSDVMELYKATEGRLGTDEILVCNILSTRNDAQIRAIAIAYEQKFKRTLEDVIKKEFSGHMEDALLFQLRHALDAPSHAASLLEDAMAGVGTKDALLVSRVIRFHWDRNFMAHVVSAYRRRYGRDLASRIRGETSGDYERLMLACIGERI